MHMYSCIAAWMHSCVHTPMPRPRPRPRPRHAHVHATSTYLNLWYLPIHLILEHLLCGHRFEYRVTYDVADDETREESDARGATDVSKGDVMSRNTWKPHIPWLNTAHTQLTHSMSHDLRKLICRLCRCISPCTIQTRRKRYTHLLSIRIP